MRKKRQSLIKKTLAFMLMCMLAMLSVFPAMAAGNSSLTIHSKTDGHTFEAYQIFSGTISDGKLVDMDWGAGIDGESFFTELKKKPEFASCDSVYAVAKVVEAYDDDGDEIDAFAELAAKYLKPTPQGTQSSPTGTYDYTISGLDEGYYLIRDKEGSLGTDADAAYTKFVLWVTGSKTEANAKADIPSLKKEIKHNESGVWGDVGDNQIGDTVEFRTTTTVPAETDAYDSYTYDIHDTMDATLQPIKDGDNIQVEIKVNDETVLDKKYYTVTGTNSFVIDVDILQAIKDGAIKAGDTLVSYYKAILTKDAVIYDDGNQKNKAFLQYSNNPYDEGTGKTSEDVVYDWTFKFDVSKIDGDEGTKLNGAKFVLSKDQISIDDLKLNNEGVPTVTTSLIAFIDNGDGNYTVVPAGTEGAIYAMTAGDISIKGLDDDITYYLYETKAPTGYNLAKEPITFKISADYEDGGDSLKTGYPQVSVDGKAAKSEMSTTVDNFEGLELPGTGGIGTTIFYATGAILVIGAAVLLISRRRAESK